MTHNFPIYVYGYSSFSLVFSLLCRVIFLFFLLLCDMAFKSYF